MVNPAINASHQSADRDSASTAALSADALARMSSLELEDLYRRGTLPALSSLNGSPAGRMLTVAGALGAPMLRPLVARLARSRVFPWRGKSFKSADDVAGTGINRVRVLGNKYRFETRVEPSAIDGNPCVRLDYSGRHNPIFIRVVRDELREVAPGLFLGPAMLDGDSPKLVLWFAIDRQG